MTHPSSLNFCGSEPRFKFRSYLYVLSLAEYNQSVLKSLWGLPYFPEQSIALDITTPTALERCCTTDFHTFLSVGFAANTWDFLTANHLPSTSSFLKLLESPFISPCITSLLNQWLSRNTLLILQVITWEVLTGVLNSPGVWLSAYLFMC